MNTHSARLPGRIAVFLYGLVSYAVFLATFLYAIGFIGNFGVPKTLDSPTAGSWRDALLIDLGLLTVFALQHSVMARPAFKRLLTRVIPVSAERSTYVLASSLALCLLFSGNGSHWVEPSGTSIPHWAALRYSRATPAAGPWC